MLLKKFNRNFKLSVFDAVLTSVAIAFMPFPKILNDNGEKIFTIILGILFWVGILGTVIFSLEANSKRKLIEKRYKKKGLKLHTEKQLGLISFFKNKEATCCDAVMLISLAVTVLLLCLDKGPNWLVFILISVTFLSFCMHCCLNGKNYLYIKSIKQYFESKKERQKNG